MAINSVYAELSYKSYSRAETYGSRSVYRSRFKTVRQIIGLILFHGRASSAALHKRSYSVLSVGYKQPRSAWTVKRFMSCSAQNIYSVRKAYRYYSASLRSVGDKTDAMLFAQLRNTCERKYLPRNIAAESAGYYPRMGSNEPAEIFKSLAVTVTYLRYTVAARSL